MPGPDRVWKLISALEGKLLMTGLRMGLSHDAVGMRGVLKHGGLQVNGARPLMPHASFVQPGDVVSVAKWSRSWHKNYTCSQLGPELMGEIARDWVGSGVVGAQVQEERGRAQGGRGVRQQQQQQQQSLGQ